MWYVGGCTQVTCKHTVFYMQDSVSMDLGVSGGSGIGPKRILRMLHVLGQTLGAGLEPSVFLIRSSRRNRTCFLINLHSTEGRSRMLCADKCQQ